MSVNILSEVENNNYNIKKVKANILINKLPDEYQAVEYIESTGTQYINTLFTPNQDTRVILDYQMTHPETGRRMFGARQSSTSQAYVIYYQSSNYGFYVNYNNSQYDSPAENYSYDRHIVDFNKNNVYLDNTLYHTFTYAQFNAYGNAYIFNYNGGNVTTYGCFKLFNCKIYDNNVLIRNFIPAVRKSDNEIGLYDVVNNAFYTNIGTGTFIKGDNVTTYKPLKVQVNKLILDTNINNYIIKKI